MKVNNIPSLTDKKSNNKREVKTKSKNGEAFKLVLDQIKVN